MKRNNIAEICGLDEWVAEKLDIPAREVAKDRGAYIASLLGFNDGEESEDVDFMSEARETLKASKYQNSPQNKADESEMMAGIVATFGSEAKFNVEDKSGISWK